MTKKNIPILVICGPTASGKTSLALAIAKSIIDSFHSTSVIPDLIRDPSPLVQSIPSRVHLLSADSRQIYKGLDIVTGKDIPEDLPPSIKFFGLDLVEPNQSFNLSDYVQYSKKVIQESLSQKVPLIIVGGTGLYLKAITSDLLNVQVPPNKSLRSELEKLKLVELQNKLQEVNPEKYKSLNNSDVNNPRRLIRALEISLSLPESGLQAPRHCERKVALLDPRYSGEISLHPETKLSFHWIGLRQDKETQKSSIRQRVIDRLNSGAIQEVEQLLKKYTEPKLPLFTSLGVKEITLYLQQKISYEELINLWTLAENNYAKRQMVWFKKQSGIIWYDIDE